MCKPHGETPGGEHAPVQREQAVKCKHGWLT